MCSEKAEKRMGDVEGSLQLEIGQEATSVADAGR